MGAIERVLKQINSYISGVCLLQSQICFCPFQEGT